MDIYGSHFYKINYTLFNGRSENGSILAKAMQYLIIIADEEYGPLDPA